MTIKAQFASRCPICSGPIHPGQEVEWRKGSKAVHVACAGAAAGGTAAPVQTAPAPASTRTITVEHIGRRSYLRGDTIAVRGLLGDGGCHWDADERAWWIGDHSAAEALAERAKSAPAEAAPKKRITHCLGCGGALDRYQQQRGYKFCSSDCRIDAKMGGQSGYVNGHWHQGSDD